MITPRAAALLGAGVVLGAVPVAMGVNPWHVVLAVLSGVVILVLVDRALATNPKAIWLSRVGDTNVRLGETATVELVVNNTNDAKARLLLRDLWVPSAGATPSTYQLSMKPRQRLALTTTLTPTRRGDR